MTISYQQKKALDAGRSIMTPERKAALAHGRLVLAQDKLRRHIRSLENSKDEAERTIEATKIVVKVHQNEIMKAKARLLEITENLEITEKIKRRKN